MGTTRGEWVALRATLAVAARVVGREAAAADPVEPVADKSDALSSTAVAIIAIGAVVVVALLAILYWFIRRTRTRKPTPAEAPPTAFFMTAFSPPHSTNKSNDHYSESGVNFDALTNQGPRMNAPRRAPHRGYGGSSQHSSEPHSEPVLYNRETNTTLRINDSTRSYMADSPTTAQANGAPTPKIFSSKNSVDFVYPDTDRSIDLVDINRSDRGQGYDSSRSDATSAYGFVVDSNNSARVFEVDELDSGRSSRLYDNDSFRSSQPYDDTARTMAFDVGLETNQLTPQDLRRIKVEL